MYDPKPTRYPFPEQTDQHYLVVKKDRGIVFDEHYPYVDESMGFRFRRALFSIPLVLLAWPVCRIRLGLVIRGKGNRKRFRDLLSGGLVSVSNHVHLWDFLAVMQALYFRKPAVLAWDKNINGENGTLIRMVGGIPIPVSNIHAVSVFGKAVNTFLKNGNWLHICAEGSMWEYYQPIRPFKDGAFYMAYKAGVPVLPMAFSYREPKGLRKLFHQQAVFTLNIGEPLTFNPDLSPSEAVEEMTVRAHHAVCELAGIDPKQNIYPPLFRQSKRVDYYTTEYGKSEKPSR